MMKPNIGRRKMLGTVLAGGWLQGCGGSVGLENAPPGAEETPQVTPSVADFAGRIIYIAHRGAATVYPEHTYAAYDFSLRENQVLLECDVRTLRDGALALIHDSTIDRTTPGTGGVDGLTEHEWRALRSDANEWHGSNYGNDLQLPMFIDWVLRYRGKAILIPEDKDLKSTPAMLAIIRASGVHKDQVLFQSFSMVSVRIAADAGYHTCFLNDGRADPGVTVAAGVRWAGISTSAKESDIRKWVGSGLNVLIYTVNRRYERDAHLLLGVRGFFSDDPGYVSVTAPLAKKDRFDLQTWMPGMLGSGGDDTSLPGRGKFFSDGAWGYDTVSTNYMGCLQGYLCPLIAPLSRRAYELELTVRFDSVFNGDESRWASVFLGIDDRPFGNRNEHTSGYHILFRKNGVIEVYRKGSGIQAVLLSGCGGPLIASGAHVKFKITVNETSVSASRLTSEGTVSYGISVNDDTHASAYVQLGRSGLACRFSSISVA